MSFLTPFFLAGAAAIAVPILIHLIQRERKEVVQFPSLMFLRRIPYQSVQRRKIHNWLLLLLRCAAIVLMAAAFARPFFTQDPATVAAAATGAREVVILLDRSASMGYGDRWDRAREAARKVVAGLGGTDRATLILFATGEEEAVRATSDRSQLETGIREATLSADATRYGPALRYAQSLLSRSPMPRKEAVIISDFQKTGWEQREEIHMPEGATVTPISVVQPGVANISVTKADFARQPFAGNERVAITVLLNNRGPEPVANLPVTLEVDGHEIESRPATIGANASGSVTFNPISVADANMRGVVRAGSDLMPADNAFYFVLSPGRPVSVLVVNPDGAPALSSLYVTTALEQGGSPVFEPDVVALSRVTPSTIEKRSVIVLNNVGSVPAQVDALLKRFVEQGGGLFVAIGDRTPWGSAGSPLLPGTLGKVVDRSPGQGTFGKLEHSHPVFELFKQPHTGDFTAGRFYRYRELTPAATDAVLARYDDGAPAVVERKVGSGRVMAFTSTLDDSWNYLQKTAVFVPFVQLSARYLAQYDEPVAWYTVGRMLDVAAPIGQIVREGGAGDARSASPRRANGVVTAPSGAETRFGEGGVPAVRLEEQGFYLARMQGTGDRRPYAVAVNLDPAESDLTPMEPTEFVTTATGRAAAVTPTGQSLERPELTPADIEKKQTIWWFLLLAGAAALWTESVLANRMSRKFGAGLLHVTKSSHPPAAGRA